MSTRRGFIAGLVVVGAQTIVAGGAQARQPAEVESIAFESQFSAGTVVVRTRERRLYLVTGPNRALRYPVAVGRPRDQWTGSTTIDGKHIKPAWSPPAIIRREKPSLPSVIPGGAPGNPMGVAALTLSGGGQYAIHGTNVPGSIGTFASYGCIRMHNEHISDLFQRVSIGTPVVVLP